MSELWTISELSDRVESALAQGYLGPPTGRVRAVPDQRTIRYYTTLGLLDRPAEMTGRTALYSVRHLEQLVAIKRLQARGLSLAAVQAELAAASPAEVARLAGLGSQVVGAAAAQPLAPSPRSARFWASAPSDAPGEDRIVAVAERSSDRIDTSSQPAVSAPPRSKVSDQASRAPTVQTIQRIELAPGLVVELATAAALTQTELAALRVVSEQLTAFVTEHPRLCPTVARPPVTPTEGTKS